MCHCVPSHWERMPNSLQVFLTLRVFLLRLAGGGRGALVLRDRGTQDVTRSEHRCESRCFCVSNWGRGEHGSQDHGRVSNALR